MQNNTQHANWANPYSFMLKNTYRVGERWWGSRADKSQTFWADPCLTIQFSFAWPWLRIATGYRLRTIAPYDPHFATVTSKWSAAHLLRVILADITSFKIWQDRFADNPDIFSTGLNDDCFSDGLDEFDDPPRDIPAHRSQSD